jgi:hypothetical protein
VKEEEEGWLIHPQGVVRFQAVHEWVIHVYINVLVKHVICSFLTLQRELEEHEKKNKKKKNRGEHRWIPGVAVWP